MTLTRTFSAACALAAFPVAFFAGAAQAHCRHDIRRTHLVRFYAAPREIVRSSFVEPYPVYRPEMVRPVALRREIVVPAYRPEIGAGEAIVVARRNGLARLKRAEHQGGHWNVDGWTWDGRWLEAQVYGDGRLKRIDIDG